MAGLFKKTPLTGSLNFSPTVKLLVIGVVGGVTTKVGAVKSPVLYFSVMPANLLD